MSESHGEQHWLRVTPEVAKQMLSVNYGRQRNISESRVKSYVRDMRDGRWNSNAMPPIRISSDGFLVDGQHRLRAVIDYGAPVDMLVWYGGGTAEELFEHLDCNLVRRAEHFVECKNKNVVLGMSKILRCLECGAILGNAVRRMIRQLRVNGKKVVEYPSRSEIVDFANAHLDEMVSAAELAVSLRRVTFSSPTIAGAFIYAIREIDGRDNVDAYVNDLMSVFPKERMCAVMQRAMIRKYTEAKSSHGSVDDSWTFGALAYGYELYLSGREVKVITTKACEGAFQRLDARIQEHVSGGPAQLSIAGYGMAGNKTGENNGK